MTQLARRLRAIPSWQITLGFALLALGFLIAAQLAAQGPRVRYTTQERTPLVETATELQRQHDELRDQITKLRSDIATLEAQGQGTTELVRALNQRLEDARIAAGLIPLTGTGLNTFGTAMFQYQTFIRDQHVYEAHNDYLQLAAEGGLLLSVPIVATLIVFVRAVARRFRAGEDDTRGYWIRVGAVVGLTAIAVQSIVEFSLQMPGNAALFVVLAAIALHRAPARASSRPATASARA